MSFQDGIFGEHTIRWFNGGLFEDNAVIQLDKSDMGILHEVAHSYNWAHIAPAIFGTLFERSLDPSRRSLIGAHYTSEEDILLLIEPVVMRPLEQRWATVRDSILTLLAPKARPIPTQGNAAGPSAPTASTMLRIPAPMAHPIPAQGNAAGPFAPTASTTSRTPAPTAHPIPAQGNALGEHRAAKTRAEGPPHRTASLLTSNPQAENILAAWFDELAAIRILDPACGSGNFLYVALRRLLDLWKQTRDFAAEHNIQLAMQYAVEKMVSPLQLFGIETEFYAHELASIVVWIGFLQWKHEHGILEDREPILQKLDNIEHADAILRYDAESKPYEPQWPKADFIIGNPPFLGGKLLRRELGDSYVDSLFDVYRGRVKAESDLVVYWFEKARAQIEAEEIPRMNSLRVGLLATQGIRGGANRNVLERILRTGNIFWAISDRNWLLDGANVHVSMIAFERGRIPGIKHPLLRDQEEEKLRRVQLDPAIRGMLRRVEEMRRFEIGHRLPGVLDQLHAEAGISAPTARPIPAQGIALGQETHEQTGLKARPIAPAIPISDPTAPCVLDGQPVPFINPDLTTGSNTASAHRLNENAGLSFIGDQKGGKFELTASDATALLRLPANPNGKTNADVIRHWINGSDITSRSRGLYIIDFGVDMSERDAAFYEAPFERTKVLVYPTRKNNRREVRKKKWWIHHEPMPAMRAAVAGLNRYIVTPRVSKHRIFAWVASETLADSAVVAIAREDDYFFGLLHSKAHEIWARAQGTQLREMESGFRYTPNSTFDTFPFPWPPGTESTEADSEAPRVKAIAEAARSLVHLRDAWLNPPGASESDLKSRTLTNLYNARPEWLANAHRTLDEAVFSAYGWPLEVDGKALTTQEILARLLALNHQRAAAASPGKEDL